LFLTFYILSRFYWNIIIYLGRALPVIENLPNSIQNNRPSNQTNTVNEQPAASGTIEIFSYLYN
jgi:hypothetical protein